MTTRNLQRSRPPRRSLPPVALLGAGRMGWAVASDLLAGGVERLHLVDVELANSEALAVQLGDRRVVPAAADLSDPACVRSILKDVAAVVSAVPYRLNLGLAKETIRSGAHWVDLGGNTDVVEATLALGRRARVRKACVAPDCGLQPGLGGVLLGDLFRRLGGADDLKLLVGGLPQRPRGRLKYQFVFSVEGLMNEYRGDVRTLHGGALRIRRPLAGVEAVPWRGYPALEAFRTSGSASTLPATFAGRVRSLEVKTIRYRGHATELRRIFRTAPPAKRAAYLERHVPHEGKDLVLLRAEARQGTRRLFYEMEDRFHAPTGMTAMMRTTGFPASIVSLMALRGQVAPGAVLQERDVPADRMIAELAARGIDVRFGEATAAATGPRR